jgi:universal stress protein E
MHPFDPVLAIVDPTADAQPAAEKAALIAASVGARLSLLVCDYEATFDPERFRDSARLRELRDEWLAQRQSPLDRLAQGFRANGIAVEATVRWSARLHAGVLAAAEDLSPGLIVKDTHYHSALRRSLFSNTDWHLIRESRWPLLLVKPVAWHEEPRVLAALDPGQARGKPDELDAAILEIAERLRASLNGDLHVLHAFNAAALSAASVSPPSDPAAGLAAVIDAERARLERAIATLGESYRAHVALIHLEEGAAAAVLCRAAQDLTADIMVMGAISRSHVRERLLGSTAERALDQLCCDVLVVKPRTGAAR